jgi:hypothetical protein
LNEPAASAATAVEVSIADAMSTLPHGLAVLGFWTFARASVPVTPSAGETPACALAWRASAIARTAEVKTVENMLGLRASSTNGGAKSVVRGNERLEV